MSAKKTTAKKTAKKAIRRRELAPPGSFSTRDVAPPNPFAKAWDAFVKAVEDLTTVDVTTLQGNVLLELSSNGKFNPSEFFEKIQAQIKPGGEVTLVAHTHVEFDLDCVMLAQPNADSKLMDAHHKAVQAALDARQAVLRLVKEIVMS